MGERLSAEEIERADFSIGLRGYDRDEVEAFLRDVAGQQRRLLQEVEASRERTDKPYHVFGADVGELLQHAKDSADALVRKAEEDAAGIREQARKAAAATREKAEQDAQAARKAAEYDAGERIKAAEHRVAQLRAEEARAREKLESVRRELESVSARLLEVESSLDGRAASPDRTAGANGGQPTEQAAPADQAAPTEQPAPAEQAEVTEGEPQQDAAARPAASSPAA